MMRDKLNELHCYAPAFVINSLVEFAESNYKGISDGVARSGTKLQM